MSVTVCVGVYFEYPICYAGHAYPKFSDSFDLGDKGQMLEETEGCVQCVPNAGW